jgi:hypothetical protein
MSCGAKLSSFWHFVKLRRAHIFRAVFNFALKLNLYLSVFFTLRISKRAFFKMK